MERQQQQAASETVPGVLTVHVHYRVVAILLYFGVICTMNK